MRPQRMTIWQNPHAIDITLDDFGNRPRQFRFQRSRRRAGPHASPIMVSDRTLEPPATGPHRLGIDANPVLAGGKVRRPPTSQAASLAPGVPASQRIDQVFSCNKSRVATFAIPKRDPRAAHTRGAFANGCRSVRRATAAGTETSEQIRECSCGVHRAGQT